MNARPPFPIPNFLSLLRILIGLAIPFLLMGPASNQVRVAGWAFWTAFLLFLFGAFTDFWDGWFARRHRLETPLGRVLDPTADKVFILATMASFSAKGLYSHWFLAPIFFREIAVTFCRVSWLYQGKAIGAEVAGKLKLGFQVASVACSFLYLALPSPISFGLNYVVLVLAVLITLFSGATFFLHNRDLLMDKKFLRLVAALGVGYLRPIPGTYGTLLGLALIPLIAHDFFLHITTVLLFFLLAYLVIPRLGLGEREDPLEIVIDEFCGILLAFVAVPVSPPSLLTGFIFFRIFDVTKLFPLNWLERRRGVNGIMLDDVGAGVYTWLILRIVFS